MSMGRIHPKINHKQNKDCKPMNFNKKIRRVVKLPNTIPEFVWWVFVSVIGICGFLVIWVLTKIDKNQTEIFNRLNGVEERISTLEGEHKTVMTLGLHKG